MPKKINKPRHGRVKIIVVGNQHGKAVLFERLQAALEQTMGASVPPWGLLAGRKIGRSFVEEVTESMKWMKHKLEEHTITSVKPGDLVSFDHMGKVLVGVVLENTSKFAKDHKLLAVRGYGDVVYNIPPDAIKSLISAPAPKDAALAPCAYCGMDIASGCAIQSQDGKRRYCADHFTSEDLLTNDDAWARIDLLDSEKAEIEQRKAAIEQQAAKNLRTVKAFLKLELMNLSPDPTTRSFAGEDNACGYCCKPLRYGDMVYGGTGLIHADCYAELRKSEQAKLDGWSTQLTPEPEAPLVHCHICGKLIDPDTAVASGYNGDLCCQDHFSASAEEVEAVTEDQATIADLQDRLALAEQKYLDEKSRRAQHGKRLHEAQKHNAELLRKNIDLHLERRKALTPGQLHYLRIIAKTGNVNVKDVSSAIIRELIEDGLIKYGYNDNGKQVYDLTNVGKALVEKYYNILTYGGICDFKAIRGYDILRREILRLVGEKAGAKLELEEVRKERDNYRKELLESEDRADSLSDSNHEIACELSRARARLAEMVYIIENRSVVRNQGCVWIEMNSACYGIFSNALKGTGPFSPQD